MYLITSSFTLIWMPQWSPNSEKIKNFFKFQNCFLQLIFIFLNSAQKRLSIGINFNIKNKCCHVPNYYRLRYSTKQDRNRMSHMVTIERTHVKITIKVGFFNWNKKRLLKYILFLSILSYCISSVVIIIGVFLL